MIRRIQKHQNLKKRTSGGVMKKIMTSILCLFLFSCKQEKIDFIPSETIDNVFFLKNLPNNDSILKLEIKNFIHINVFSNKAISLTTLLIHLLFRRKNLFSFISVFKNYYSISLSFKNIFFSSF